MNIITRLSILGLILITLQLRAKAQDDRNLARFKTVLQKELGKAGVSVPPASIKFHLIRKGEKSDFGLAAATADAFHLSATQQTISVWSKSEAGIQAGIYWYLNRLGFRYYFPGAAWHYIPKLQSGYREVQHTGTPSFESRRIWYAYGTGSKLADADFKFWEAANLLGGAVVNAGHSYEAIVSRNKGVFLSHPEFFAQKVEKGAIPKNPKFDVSNEQLVQLVIKDALEQVSAYQVRTGSLPVSISMDPSDGGGFATSEAALKIGGPSAQTYYLANRVARAVGQRYPGVQVGLYAYNQHAAPPAFPVEPNIIVLVATAMNQSAYRTDELIQLWRKKGVKVGIRDYYGVMAWDWDMPGKPAGGKMNYVSQLRKYHGEGIRIFSAETNIGWVSRGLGHYVAASLLWDINVDTATIIREFYRNMFGKAAATMASVFNSWQHYSEAVPKEGDLYQWSRLVQQAAGEDKDALVQERIRQVQQYLVYVHLFSKWRKEDSEANLVRLLNYAYRVQDQGNIASYPLFRRLASGAVAGKPHLRFSNPNATWKQPTGALSISETEQLYANMLRDLDRSAVTVNTLLPNALKRIPANKMNAAVFAGNSLPVKLRGGHLVVVQVFDRTASLQLTQGLIKVKEYKTLQLKVYPFQSDLSITGSRPLIEQKILPGTQTTVSLASLPTGTYLLHIDDARDGFKLSFAGGVAYGIVAGAPRKAWTFGRNTLVFEVKDITSFSIQNEGAVTLKSPTGRIIDLQQQKGKVSISVGPGEQGLWQLLKQSGKFSLQGVLPLIAADKDFIIRHEE
ncbi:DUF4838 domain-containing protein [Paracnuella aquatica]|uniref:DUF4838 domain-containing protein n=1 Tax=Paracnuella aquatica TaxID=2268757 RepID=UPI0013901F66|nr:DUF4838 domain-containing protein [Paracnuella aquatica]